MRRLHVVIFICLIAMPLQARQHRTGHHTKHYHYRKFKLKAFKGKAFHFNKIGS